MPSHSPDTSLPYSGSLRSDTTTFQGFRNYFDGLFSRSIGGLLPEISSVSGISRVLDVGCGPGAWALDMAATHPHMQIVGIDPQAEAIDYAGLLAKAEGLEERTQFQVMGHGQHLDFPDGSFDLLNASNVAWRVVKRDMWADFLSECVRVVRPGGFIRLTEFELACTNSLANQRLEGSTAMAFHLAGHSFSPDGRSLGIAPMLAPMLRRAGCQNVNHHVHGIDVSYGIPRSEEWIAVLITLNQLNTKFIASSGAASQEEQKVWFLQAMEDLRSPSYCGMLFFLTAWGQC